LHNFDNLVLYINSELAKNSILVWGRD